MERMPNELLLAVFGDFTFNELRTVMAPACAGERCGSTAAASGQTSRHLDRTPCSCSIGLCAMLHRKFPAHALLQCTNGRKFTLRLHGLFPRILAAAAENMHRVERLEVKLDHVGDMGVLSDAMRDAQAPELVPVSLTFCSHALGSELPLDLFAGMAFPALTTVVLKNVRIPEDGSLQCFSCARNVRYWPHGDLLAPSPPDLFGFPASMRALNLRGHVANMD